MEEGKVGESPSSKESEEVFKDSLSIAEEIASSMVNILDDKPTPHKFARILVDEIKSRIPVKTFVQGNSLIGIYVYEKGVYREGEREVRAIFDSVMNFLRMEERSRRYSGYLNDFMSILRNSTIAEATLNEKIVLYYDIGIDWEAFFYSGLPGHEDEKWVFNPSPDLMAVHRIPWRIDLDVLARYRDKELESVLEGFRNETVISKYYEDWVGDKYPLLLQLTGYTLLAGKYPLKSFFTIFGDRNSGKTTFANLLEKLLGEENISNETFQDLASDKKRFSRAELFHKMANICDDLPSEIVQETGWIKMLTGESRIRAERKFKDPFTFYNYAKLIFLCNDPPIVRKADEAFWDRARVIEFPNTFQKDEGKKKAILEEVLPMDAPKLLAFSLSAVKHAYADGKFYKQDTPEDSKRKWMRRADPVFNFLETGKEGGWIKEEEGFREESSRTYNLYSRFCDVEGLENVGKTMFTRRMGYYGHLIYPALGKKYYKGIKILWDKLPEELRESSGL
jgi:P4 family phage/plasmid primase-like protien